MSTRAIIKIGHLRLLLPKTANVNALLKNLSGSQHLRFVAANKYQPEPLDELGVEIIPEAHIVPKKEVKP